MPLARKLLVQGIETIEAKMIKDENFVADVSGKILSQEVLLLNNQSSESDLERGPDFESEKDQDTERAKNDSKADLIIPDTNPSPLSAYSQI